MCIFCGNPTLMHDFGESDASFDAGALTKSGSTNITLSVSSDILASAGSTSVGPSGNQYIDGLLSKTKWSGNSLTYSFPDSPTDYAFPYDSGEPTRAGFAQVSLAQMQAVRHFVEGIAGGPGSIYNPIESFTNLNFTELAVGSGGADIMLAQSPAANPTAYAYYPSNSANGGDVWFGNNNNYRNPLLGTYSYETHLHEVGHTVGLKHGQETTVFGALPADRDDLEFSVMTYRSYLGAPTSGGYTNEQYGYPQTYMMYDIAALQYMYGADFSYNNNDTVYVWSPTSGEMFVNGVGQGAPGGGIGGAANRTFLTVWDGGGTDTYYMGNYSTNVTINLNPEAWSVTSDSQLAYLGSGHYAQGNVYNAMQYNGDPRSLIENAVGGSGNDIIVGSAYANVLVGGAGNDLINGLGGNDTVIYDGLRSDYLIGPSSLTGWIHIADLRPGAPNGSDDVVNVEFFQFAAGTLDQAHLFNHAPVVSVPQSTVATARGQTLQIASYFSVTDADNDPVAYLFYDSTPGGGHIVVKGVEQPALQVLGLTAAQLAQTTFVPAAGASDDLLIGATDGNAFSGWSSLHIDGPVNHAPVVTVGQPTVTATTGQIVQLSNFFSVTDADNDPVVYLFYDSTPGGGHIVVNGVEQAAQQIFGVTAAQLAQTTFVPAPNSSDDLLIGATDGTFSGWTNFHVNGPVNHAPVVTVSASPVQATSQPLQLSNFFSVTDPDNDAFAYLFYDSTPGGGHIVVNGAEQAANQIFGLTAAQLAQTTFVSAAGSSDDLLIGATDGAFSGWSSLHVNGPVNHAPVVTVSPSTVVAAQGVPVQLSNYFSVTDPDSDPFVYLLYDSTPAGGHVVVNSVEQPANQVLGLTAAQLAQTTFVAGGTEDLLIGATDGQAFSGWSSLHIV